ncbi:hypothetical protein [Flaviflagellibacter deserti]|uniref:Uncharacterized protein n=1 Tax=Flaviflagellibacter deserti TaxID=2267266 RepID=A0ABV9YZP0_9HYPH
MRKPGKLHVATITALGGLILSGLVLDTAPVRAESALEFLLNQARRSRPQPRYESPPPPVTRFFDFFGPREFIERPRRAAAVSHDFERVVCRRICDGAEIALGIMPEKPSYQDAELMCTAAGNGSPTKLIVEKFEPGAGFTPTSVAKADTETSPPLLEGRAALGQNPLPKPAQPVALACPLSQTAEPFMVPLLHDATLRGGDVVATKEGFKVFVGRGDPPFSPKDFVDVDKSKRVSDAIRKLKIATR